MTSHPKRKQTLKYEPKLEDTLWERVENDCYFTLAQKLMHYYQITPPEVVDYIDSEIETAKSYGIFEKEDICDFILIRLETQVKRKRRENRLARQMPTFPQYH